MFLQSNRSKSLNDFVRYILGLNTLGPDNHRTHVFPDNEALDKLLAVSRPTEVVIY